MYTFIVTGSQAVYKSVKDAFVEGDVSERKATERGTSSQSREVQVEAKALDGRIQRYTVLRP